MKFFITLFFILVAAHLSCSQSLTRNAVYLEIGGASYPGSVNYERSFPMKNPAWHYAFRGGITYYNYFRQDGRHRYGIPVGAFFILSGRKVALEMGMTLSFVYEYDDIGFEGYFEEDLFSYLGLRMGVRRNTEKPGFFWNALLQPTLEYNKSWGHFSDLYTSDKIWVYPSISFGIGYAF